MIKVNETSYEYERAQTLESLRRKYKADADIVIYNGFATVELAEIEIADGDEVVLIKRGEMPSKEELEGLMVSRHTPGVHKKLKGAIVGIAGVGGLGSSVAVALARVGVGKLVIADYDVVEPSNLNRQQYFVDQLGEAKVDALYANLKRINPYVEVSRHKIVLTEENIYDIFKGVSVLVEGFDRAELKSMLVNAIYGRDKEAKIVMASGLGGYGDANKIMVRRLGRGLYIVGDGKTGARPGMGLMSPRVGVAAHHQANKVLELILESDKS